MLMNLIPRLKVEAIKPPISVKTPPPTFITNACRSVPKSLKASQRLVTVSMFLLSSPESISKISYAERLSKSAKSRGKQ